MKKWQKFLLSLLGIGYLVGLTFMLWPHIVVTCLNFFKQMNFDLGLKSHDLIQYYGITLLIITAIIFLIILFLPNQKQDVILSKSKHGQLALTNSGIVNFIKIQLSGAGLSNVKVSIKNTKHKKQFYVVADAAYKDHVVKELPQLEQTLITKLTGLLEGIDNSAVKVDLKINQASGNKKKASTRVV